MVTQSQAKEWRRHHDDDSYGKVDLHESGAFIGADLVKVNDIGIYGAGRTHQFSTLEEACAAMDAKATDRGHRCSSHCGEWRPEP